MWCPFNGTPFLCVRRVSHFSDISITCPIFGTVPFIGHGVGLYSLALGRIRINIPLYHFFCPLSSGKLHKYLSQNLCNILSQIFSITYWLLKSCVVSYICKVEKGKTHWFVKIISKNRLTKFGKYAIIVIENKKRITNEIETFIFSKKIKKILDKNKKIWYNLYIKVKKVKKINKKIQKRIKKSWQNIKLLI